MAEGQGNVLLRHVSSGVAGHPATPPSRSPDASITQQWSHEPDRVAADTGGDAGCGLSDAIRDSYTTELPLKPEDLKTLVTLPMPYGKYKGRLIADLPGAYLAWYARKGFPPGQLGVLLALALELDHNGLKGLLDPLRADRKPPR